MYAAPAYPAPTYAVPSPYAPYPPYPPYPTYIPGAPQAGGYGQPAGSYPTAAYGYQGAVGYPYPAGYPGAGAPAAGYGAYAGYYNYPVYVPLYVRRRAPGETYALVISWVVTVAGSLSILCGLLVGIGLLFALAQGSTMTLTAAGAFTGFFFAPLAGGVLALLFGIRGILRRRSPRFSLPHPWLFGGLTVVTYVAAIVFWHLSAAPGPALAILPLVCVCVGLPPLTLLAVATWRLRMPTSQRHVWMSLIYGSTLAALLALILNTIGEVVLVLFVAANSPHGLTTSTPSPTDPTQILLLFVLGSVIAPLVEEGVKPLGAVLIMRRLRTPAGAFLVGMASGVGFSIFETLAIYVGQGEADWVVVALERFGAGFLHGVGAGMGALGWYYFINGKGVRLRWLRGVGCLLYAVVQHGVYNGIALLISLPNPLTKALQTPIYLGRLPVDAFTLLLVVYWALIVGFMVFITGRLLRASQVATPPMDGPPASGVGVLSGAAPALVGTVGSVAR